MPKHDWRCLVCEATNVAAESSCHLCGAPVQLSAKEIESLRAGWEAAENTTMSVVGDFGLPTKLALFTVAYLVVFIVLLELASSGGANPIGIGMVFAPLFIPVPLLTLAWIVAVINSSLRSKVKK